MRVANRETAMKNFRDFLLGLSAGLLLASPAFADPAPLSPPPSSPSAPTEAAPVATAPAPQVQDDPVLTAVRAKLSSVPAADNEHDRKDQTALVDFYTGRHGEALWVTAAGLKPEAKTLAAEIANAGAYALDPSRFKLPTLAGGALTATDTDSLADAEIQYSKAALLYARDARGGRIPDPAEMLTTNLDRRPQWIEPRVVIEALAATHEPDAYLRSLQPQQPQFEKLRQIYLTMLPKDGKPGPLSPAAKRIRANMEMWRWMWPNMGDFYVLNNIPEFMQYVYKDGQIIRSEKIVAGLVDKQSTIFSRPLKYVVLRPAWRVPESIKVNELWPNLIRGGGMMRQYALQNSNKGRRQRRLSQDRLGDDRHPQLRSDPAAGTEKCARARQVLVPEPAHDLHARYAGQVDVPASPTYAEPRLPARLESDATGRTDPQGG